MNSFKQTFTFKDINLWLAEREGSFKTENLYYNIESNIYVDFHPADPFIFQLIENVWTYFKEKGNVPWKALKL